MDDKNVRMQNKATIAQFGETFSTPKQARHEYSLFISGRSQRSERCIKVIRRVCDRYIGDNYSIFVIDVFEDPDRAEAEKIFVTPTLVRRQPLPLRRIVGDFSSEEALASSMELDE